MKTRKSAAFVSLSLALAFFVSFVGDAIACPKNYYNKCVLGACVCVPNSRAVLQTPEKVVAKVKEDPVKILVNPYGFINKTGIPTQGDIFEFVVKDPEKVIELVNNPGQWPYLPVASGIISGRNAVVTGGGRPIPPNILAELRRWYPDDLLTSVRWTSNWGPLRNSLQAAQMNFNSSTQAIALINAVVFRDDAVTTDPALWAHEVYHVQQYREWGVFGFAKRWVDNSSRNGPVERPAYLREDEARQVLGLPDGGNVPQTVPSRNDLNVRQAVPNPQSGLPSGAPLSMCGCWGFVPPGANRPASQCASGIDVPRMCPGVCPAGGAPWQASCY